MNNKHFNLWMTSIDDSYLEEAAQPPQKKQTIKSAALAVAACLVLAATGLLLGHTLLLQNSTPKDSITKEYFVKEGTDYTLLSCEAAEPTDISGIETAETEPLIWIAAGLEIKLCSTRDMAWVSWYDTNTSTQWCLTSKTSTLALLTTAREIVEDLGYNVAVAPEDATDITYDAFLLNNLTVAETTFLLDGVRYCFRMAATAEVSMDFADISGTGTNYGTHCSTEVGWCPAETYYTENGYGKIIWFDIAPGLLYSLSMETNASEETLLTLAHELFSPAQDAASW